MTSAISFTYQSGNSLIHQLDSRCKLACLCLLSMFMIHAGLTALSIFSLILLILLRTAKIAFYPVFRGLKYFLLLLFIIVAARAMTTSGDVIMRILVFEITRQGIMDGITLAWRFLCIMILGLILTTTTKPSQIKSAVQWFLKPVPWIPEQRVGVMISLILRFLPQIIDQTKKIQEAQAARCGHLEKNPLKKIGRVAVPLLKRIFSSADTTILAMEARCYSDHRTDPAFKPCGHEGTAMLTVLGLAVMMIYL